MGIDNDGIALGSELSTALGMPTRLMLTAEPGGVFVVRNGDGSRPWPIQRLFAVRWKVIHQEPDVAFARRRPEAEGRYEFYLKLGKLRNLEPRSYRPEPYESGFSLVPADVELEKGLDLWTGEFGREYTQRNAANDWKQLVPGFARLIDGLDIHSVLEVGCNAGHNLHALKHLLPKAELAGVDPYKPALEIARRQNVPAEFVAGSILELPFPNDSFDLVFTRGVMSTVSEDDLESGLAEIHRVSRRYLAFVEYHSKEVDRVPYCGRHDIVLPRDYVKLCCEQFPGIEVLRDERYEHAEASIPLHSWVFDISNVARAGWQRDRAAAG